MRTLIYKRRRYFIGPVILIAVAAFSALVMLLWNALMPVIFSLPVITFWQALGLLVLSKLLFGMNRHHSHWRYSPWKSDFREKISKMTPEEKKAFFKKMHSMRESWHRHYHDCGNEETEKNE
ncbi:MAG: hypothetical protein HC831_04225 [Chloroflexia bacterium]|nr:hypothetical protein [Chloroflexia bacterium]